MLQIKTTKLQEMLSRAIKGAGGDPKRPITTYLVMEMSNGKFTLTTTNDVNYLYIQDDVDCDEDFYACVSIDKFPKLIARLTCEDVTLELKDNYLEVTGNGKYQIGYELDDSTGEMVRFPNPLKTDISTKVGEITRETITTVLTAIKPALAANASRPQYLNYYMGDLIVATDTFKISALQTKVFTDKARLLTAATVDLLDTMVDDLVEIYADDNRILFKSEHGVLFGYTNDNLMQSFLIDKLKPYLERSYPSCCKIYKNEILQAIERISLFVDYFDNDVININFENDALAITSNQDNSSETISYITKNAGLEPCNGKVLLERFRTQIKAQSSDMVEIYFGDGKSIKIVDNDLVLVAALGTK